jgi:hypothetical protein
MKVKIHAFLISELDASEWSTLFAGILLPGEKPPGTHWIRGWTGPTAGLDVMAERKSLSFLETKPQPISSNSVNELSWLTHETINTEKNKYKTF